MERHTTNLLRRTVYDVHVEHYISYIVTPRVHTGVHIIFILGLTFIIAQCRTQAIVSYPVFAMYTQGMGKLL